MTFYSFQQSSKSPKPPGYSSVFAGLWLSLRQDLQLTRIH